MMQQISKQQTHQQVDQQSTAFVQNFPAPIGSMITGCLVELQAHCFSKYPDEKPILSRNAKSFILEGGLDPLDHIYIFKNPGDTSDNSPPHWHFVGLGLTDVYGYGKFYQADKILRDINPTYAACSGNPPVQVYPDAVGLNGFGIELTMRVKCDDFNSEPPTWPRHLMQRLASYVIQSKNIPCVGDHFACYQSLDNDESEIQHMLFASDLQLGDLETSLGKVKFLQVIGIFQEELQAAREWNGHGILEIMREHEETGGKYLVTDMRRGESIFALNPENRDRVAVGIETNGSNMTLVTAKHKFSSNIPYVPKWFKDIENLSQNVTDKEPNDEVEEGEIAPLVEEESFIDNHPPRNLSRMSYESESALMFENVELQDQKHYPRIYLLLSLESAKVLPLMLNGRLAHQKSFSYRTSEGDLMTSFIPEGIVEGNYHCKIMVSKDQPFVRKGIFLQIYVSDELKQAMLDTINQEGIRSNTNYAWEDHKLYITVVDEIED